MDVMKEDWLIWGLPESKFFVLTRQHLVTSFSVAVLEVLIFLWQKLDEIRVHWAQLGPSSSFETSFVQSLNRGLMRCSCVEN